MFRSTAARRARVSRLPRPASTRMRVVSVSSRVKLPELPEARMETRNPMRDSPGETLKIMAERRERVNAEGDNSTDYWGNFGRDRAVPGRIKGLFGIRKARVGTLKAHLRQEGVLGAAGSGVGSEELRIFLVRLIQLIVKCGRLRGAFEQNFSGIVPIRSLMSTGKPVEIDGADQPVLFKREDGILSFHALSH